MYYGEPVYPSVVIFDPINDKIEGEFKGLAPYCLLTLDYDNANARLLSVAINTVSSYSIEKSIQYAHTYYLRS
jgi:hypothetical protein